MKAGFGKADFIFPEGFFPREGFVESLDALHARVLLLEEVERVAILSLEMTSLPPDAVSMLQEVLRRVAHADECFVCATHTFSAPHLMPDHVLHSEADRQSKSALAQLLCDASAQAASQAESTLCEARLSLGQAECLVNAARDIETPAGWWIDTCGPGDADHRMTVLRVEGTDGTLLGALLHYAVQSSVLDGSVLSSGGKTVSGDLAGELCRRVEQHFPQAVALFLIGAAGDQVPRDKAVRVNADALGTLLTVDRQEAAIPLLRALGKEAADAAISALEQAKPIADTPLAVHRAEVVVPAKLMEHDLHALHPTRIPPYKADGESVQPIELLTIGGLRLLCVKPELNCRTAAGITDSTSDVLIATMVNGGAKYMADEQSYDRITYEAMNSPFAKGAAERLTKEARKLLWLNCP